MYGTIISDATVRVKRETRAAEDDAFIDIKMVRLIVDPSPVGGTVCYFLTIQISDSHFLGDVRIGIWKVKVNSVKIIRYRLMPRKKYYVL